MTFYAPKGGLPAQTDLTTDRAVFTGFYMFVWRLFFLEYVIVPLAWVMS